MQWNCESKTIKGVLNAFKNAIKRITLKAIGQILSHKRYFYYFFQIRVCIRIYVYMRSKLGGKGTKKNPHTQIYVDKNAKFVIFARETRSLNAEGEDKKG